MKKISPFLYTLIVFVLDSNQVFAQAVNSTVSTCNLTGVSDLKSLLSSIVNCFLRPSIVVILSLAIFIFLYKIFIFITTNNVEKKEEMRDFAVWGVVAIFVMISLWGLVNVLQRTFTFQDRVTPRNVNISY